MDIIPMLLKEMEQEAQTTRKMLERIPADKFDWQPHEKSMTVRRLATHIAELPGWVTMVITTDELDFAANPYQPEVINDTKRLLEVFEESYKGGYSSLSETNEPELLRNWTLRNGDQTYSSSPKVEVIRMAFCQTVHHRAQLGVFLRLLNVPIPGSYGPSADETEFNL
ncbi:DinB family protein [Mucilaginibacter sp. X4EP1]|uniref:DinB family protein n=1 Tax=Mucilaginibacter sp. X4EP1 TaxID=2723092 RepID=UPI00216819C6|nr:DinB family protein [Mucilaginibacter sp. X4EP1]MCS3815594.1 putative damage-inducible protein DinB [Mucilaginibacter sp. X4EP1]